MTIYKSKSYTWAGQDISFEVNWTIRTRVQDPTQVSWFRDTKFTFKSWDEVKWPDRLSLPALFLDVYPEFTKMIEGKIRLRTTRLQEMFPWTIYTFNLSSDDVYEPKEEEKMWEIDPKLLLQLKNDIKEEIKHEIRAELIKEIVAELSWKDETQILDSIAVPENHKLIQKDRDGKVVWSFLNGPHAANQTGVSKASISQNIKWKTVTAGWFIWSLRKQKSLTSKTKNND